MSGFLDSAAGWADTLLPALWRASWQGAIAIGAVWMMTRVFSLSPRVICWAWRLVCLKMLIALVWMQPIELAVLPRATTVIADSAPAVSLPQVDAFVPIEPEVTQPLFVSPVKVDLPQVVRQSIGWRTWLAALWCSGLAVCVAFTIRQWLQVRKLRAACSAPASNDLPNWAAEEAARLRIRRRPGVLVAQTEGPLLIGILCPAIVLPARAQELFVEAELRLMLRHELAHLKRRDLLWNWLPTVVGWLFFFHPLAWLLKRGWFESQEAACDELLIQNQAARPAEYGRLLVKLATLWPSGLPTSVAAAGVLGVYQNLERRILLMTRVKETSKQRLSLIAGLGALLAIAVIFPWRLVAQQPAAENATPAAAKQDDPLRQSATNLNRIMLAIHAYVDSAGHYPAAYSGWGSDKTGWYRDRPYLSWRVALLPFLGEQELFGKFNFSEPWDSEHNRALIAQMPAIYRTPGSKAGVGKTNYLGVFGPHAAFPDKGTLTVPDFTDGTSKTAMIVEVPDAEAVEWTRPAEFAADTKDPLAKLLGMREGGFLSVFADAAPSFISKDVSPELLKTMLSRNDGIPGNYEDWKRWDHFVQPLEKGESGAAAVAPTPGKDRNAQSDMLSHKVNFELGQNDLPAGDKITIDEVIGTSDQIVRGNVYQVKGTYKLASADQATIAAYTTVNANDPENPQFANVPELKTQSIVVKKGEGRFTLVFYMWQRGCPHVSFYSTTNSIGGVYFGTGESVYKPSAKADKKADGKIIWVNERDRVAFINLGSADGLEKRVAFGVFDPSTTDGGALPQKDVDGNPTVKDNQSVSDARKKGAIEVANVIQPHMAECRILSDTASSPLLPGDLVCAPN
jgi:beta-lactamase regulating signal transducer with metallopeptidase domain